MIKGNENIMKTNKLAFFSSDNCPPEIYLELMDFAMKVIEKEITIISGFHTNVEREVLEILIKGKQPIIICPAREISDYIIPEKFDAAYNEGRLLFASEFSGNKKRISRTTSIVRNRYVSEIADNIFIPFAKKSGITFNSAKFIKANLSNKGLFTIGSNINENLLNLGFTGIENFFEYSFGIKNR